MITHSALEHLTFVQNDKAVDWETWNGLGRDHRKANQDLVIKQPVYMEKSVALFLKVTGNHSRALRREVM